MLKYFSRCILCFAGGALFVWSVSKISLLDLNENIKNTFSPTASLGIEVTTYVPFNPSQDSVPTVKLILLDEQQFVSRNEQVRYTIEVSDAKDGDSRYGEINADKVLLEIEYLSEFDEKAGKEKIELNEKQPDHAGLVLMTHTNCFGCHADKSKHTGPSFSEMAERYTYSEINVSLLASRISGGSKGKWGTMEMPAYPDLKVMEVQQIADFVLTQGARKNHRIVPGLEGTFRTVEIPDNVQQGIYFLTASYTSSSGFKGQYAMLLPVRKQS